MSFTTKKKLPKKCVQTDPYVKPPKLLKQHAINIYDFNKIGIVVFRNIKKRNYYRTTITD